MPDEPVFQPEEIIAALEEHGVDYVVIGGIAALLHGSPHLTFDIDITPDRRRPNLERLSSALRDLKARIRTDEAGGQTFPFAQDAESLKRQDVLNLSTRAGNLDICFTPAGTAGYSDLKRDAITIDLGDQHPKVASLADVIRSKEAANRAKDRAVLPVLREILAHVGN